MSRSNYDKPFYVDVGTSIVAVRCASNHDVVIEHDHVRWKWAIEEAERVCDRLNAEVDRHQHKMREALNRVLSILRNIVGAGESDAKLIRDCNRHIRAALAAPEGDKESLERPIDLNENATHSSAVEMHEACRAMRRSAVEMQKACRAMNDDGDSTLCEKLKCPYYGEPNGCNSPTGEYPSVGSAVGMYEALKDIAAICDGGDTGGLPERIAIYNIAKAALSATAKNCELYATCSDTENVQRDALRKIKGLFRDIDLTIDCPENEAYAIADKALSVPLKNYEVGTAEEQAQRFREYCRAEVCKRKKCKTRAKALCIEACALEWAQMPYVAEQKGEDDGSK